MRENSSGRRKLPQQLARTRDRRGIGRREDEAPLGVRNGIAHECEPGARAVCSAGEFQTSDRPRNARSERTDDATIGDDVPRPIQIHVGPRRGGRRLTKIDEVRVAPGQAHQHETTTADISG